MVIAPKLDTSCSEHAISHIETNVYNLLQYAVFEKHGKLYWQIYIFSRTRYYFNEKGLSNIPVLLCLYLVCNGESLEIADDQHLYVSESFRRTVLLEWKRFGEILFAMTKTKVLYQLLCPRFNG